MERVLIVGDLGVIPDNFNKIYNYHLNKSINIIGISYFDLYYEKYFGFNYYPLDYFYEVEFDYIVLICKDEDYYNYRNYLIDKKSDVKIINHKVFDIPFFDVNKYLSLYNNTPTIISNNCVGGITYHTFSLPFNSPFINLWLTEDDFIKFLSNIDKYLKEDIIPAGFVYNYEGEKQPICLLGDIKLYCTHYTNHEDAIDAWKRRTKRINLDNTIIVFLDYEGTRIEAFNNIPLKNKICICQKNNTASEAIEMYFGEKEYHEWTYLIHDVFRYKVPLIDVLTLLCDKRVEYLSKMNINE